MAWRPGFVEMTLKVRPKLCNANGLLHGGVLMTLLDFGERLCLHLQRDGDGAAAFRHARLHHPVHQGGARRRRAGDLVATGAGTFRYLKGERGDGMLTFLDQKAAD